MKLTVLDSLVIALLLVGCSSPAKPKPEDTVRKVSWYRTQEGLIASGVLPNEFVRVDEKIGDTTASSLTMRSPNKEVHDPLEDMPEFRAAFDDASRAADLKAKPYEGQLGAVHIYWSEKKRVLKEKYRIDWKTPSELNPYTSYD